MINLFSFLFENKYPKTSKYEAKSKARAEAYSKYLAFAESDTYLRYKELDDLVHSGEFEKRVHRLKHEKFKDTEAFKKWNDFKTLSNQTELKDYLKFVQSGKAEHLKQIQQSTAYREFRDLEVVLASKEFAKARSGKEFQSSEFYRQYLSHKKLKKSTEIRFANKWEQSVVYKNYKSMLNSSKLTHYETLHRYVHSNEFIQFKKEVEDPKRYKKSEEYSLLKEFNQLHHHADLVWYKKAQANNAFEEEKKWELTFEEDFDRTSLNAQKWITSYYWGKALLNDTYAVKGEKQFFQPSNIEIRDSLAHLRTKPEKVTGKVWDPSVGFITTSLNYSSALINTGHIFRQKYGKFEAKIRMSSNAPVQHHFWMVSESMSPQIDVLQHSAEKGKTITAGVQSMEGKNKSSQHHIIKGFKPDSDFHIVTLLWTPNKLEWKINGVTVHTQIGKTPDKPMYLAFSSHLFNEPEQPVHAEMAIDWVRCYQQKN